MGLINCGNREKHEEQQWKKQECPVGICGTVDIKTMRDSYTSNGSIRETKARYFQCVNDKDIATWITFINNDTKIFFSGDESGSIFTTYSLSPPTTWGEWALLEIYVLIQNTFRSAEIVEHQSDVITTLAREAFVTLLIKVLDSDNKYKSDISLLTLLVLSESNNCLILLKHTEVIYKWIAHIWEIISEYQEGALIGSVSRFKLHIVGTLKVLGNVYINSVNLRKFFIDKGGMQVWYKVIDIKDKEIIKEGLFRIEDLIYTYGGNGVSVGLIDCMVSKLVNLNVIKFWLRWRKELGVEGEGYKYVEEELERLIGVFRDKDVKWVDKG